MVERLLAKEEVAGSNPVSRSHLNLNFLLNESQRRTKLISSAGSTNSVNIVFI